MIRGLGDQYVGDCHKNTTHISSVVMHDVMVDMHTLFPCPYQVLFDICEDHASSQRFNMYQRYDCQFIQTIYFVSFGFVFLSFLDNDPNMIIKTNAYFLQICNTHKYTKRFTVQTSS